MNLVSHLLAVLGVLATSIVYGTDVLGALVMRAVWRDVDDRMLVAVNGRAHYYADRRFPVPGMLGVIATVLTVVAAAISQRWVATGAAGLALVVLVVWLGIYRTVNAPINKLLTAAALEDRVPEDARALQNRWDSVVVLRAVLQGVAVAALCVVLLLP